MEHKPSYPKKAPIHLEYELSPEQKELSDKLVENYKKGIDSLVFAVCGSGKTEIVLKTIQHAITNGHKVCFCTPRRDVVIELFNRFKTIYVRNKIALVYGGHTNNLEGDIVCCTTHQLHRYKNYFDLLIIDEFDAFPFSGNEVLSAILKRAIKGNYIMMSATASDDIVSDFKNKKGEVLELSTRFHGYPLPVPEIIKANNLILYIKLYRLIKTFQNNHKKLFIFAPTIAICEKLYSHVSIIFKNGNYVHSKRENRQQIIDDFRNGKYQFLVTTSVLERGVTMKDLQVIIFHSEHSIYNASTLVQIAGRVGRKKESPEGRVIYLANEVTKAMEESVVNIKFANSNLQNLF